MLSRLGVWPDGPICPHCGGVERIGKMGGKSTRIGTYKCYQCRKPFTVKVGTIFESSHIPLHIWLQAIFLMASSKKGISSQPAAPHPWRHPEDRMVPLASHSRGHALWRARPAGRRRQGR